MKKSLALFTAITVFAIIISISGSLQSKSNGSITPYTGAPKAAGGFEATCVNCHGGGLPNTGPHSVGISVNGNADGFVPGQTYSITARIVNATGSRAGFSLVCLDPAKANCGTLSAGTGTRIITNAGRNYLNHSGPNLKTWSFNWTAPTTNVPDSVTFYMAGMEVTSGDNVYTGKQVFRKSVVTENTTLISRSPLYMYPIPASNEIRFSHGPVKFSIYSLTGFLVKKGVAGDGEVISLAGLPQGNYIWQADSGEEKKSGRFAIQP